MNGKFRILARRIRDEMPLLERVVARAQGAWGQSKLSSDDYYLDSVALNIDNFYSGVERLFELIAKTVDGNPPKSANWHQALLE